MRKPDADRLFIESYYGSSEAFRAAVQDDYCKAQFNWSCFVDGLCKSGEITERQYDTWAFPGNNIKKPRHRPSQPLSDVKARRLISHYLKGGTTAND